MMLTFDSYRRFVLRLVFYLVISITRSNVEGAGPRTLTDVTSDVGLQNIDGVVSGFCDFDSDRDTDVLVISSTGI